MPDYREQSGQAQAWRRACHVSIQNPVPGTAAPVIRFAEEDAIRMGERVVTTPSRDPAGVSGVFTPGATFPVLNPATSQPTGQTATHDQVYVLLHSLYLHLAAKRDEAEAAAAQPPAPPAGPT